MKTEAFVVPALRQSIQSQMACETGYKLVHIDGIRPPDTLESERGTEVHDVLAKYAVHCSKERVPVDFGYLEALAYDKGQDAAEILETCRENIEIDWQNFFAAEIHAGLDEKFRPTWAFDHDGERVEMSDVWQVDSSGLSPAYCAILDVVYLYPGGRIARLPDYKTHPRAFPATTFQGKLYALIVLMHMPQVEEVTFELTFVRYANLKTSQTYYRADVPRLMEDVKRYRERQLQVHAKVAAGQELSVHPGAHCQYCPAISNFTCPIADLNPHTNMTPEERLKWQVWLDVASRVNKKAMKEYVDGTELPIQSLDENGKAYTYGPKEKEKVYYPLFADNGEGAFDMPIVDALLEWAHAHPNDLVPARKGSRSWFLNLYIGSTELNQYLKTKKRELVHNACKDRAERVTVTEMRVERDAEVDDGKGEEHRDYGDGEAA